MCVCVCEGEREGEREREMKNTVFHVSHFFIQLSFSGALEFLLEALRSGEFRHIAFFQLFNS